MQEETEKQTHYQSYVNARLNKIQKYILSHKINLQTSLCLQAQLNRREKKQEEIQEKLKWLQMQTKHNYVKLGRIQEKTDKINQALDQFRKLEPKLKNIQRVIQEFQEKREKENKAELGQSSFWFQIKQLQIKLRAHEQKIYQINNRLIKQYNNEQRESTLPETQPNLPNLPPELVATKRDLRQSILVLQQKYQDKIRKIEKAVHGIKAIQNNKGTIKAVDYDDYNLFKVKEVECQESVDNLKPVPKLQQNYNTISDRLGLIKNSHQAKSSYRKSIGENLNKVKLSLSASNLRLSCDSQANKSSRDKDQKKSKGKNKIKSGRDLKRL